ncbi:MAG: cell division protein SepF [Candidatus Bathyarchaeia archaeon]|nr:cell division protein SepF [Candidatus Bathyarchaeota archaeon]
MLRAASSLEERGAGLGTGNIYVKAVPLRELSELDKIKAEVSEGNILIVRITPIAKRSVEETKRAINELKAFVGSLGGDIARLGTERIVVTPPSVRIWRGE